MLHTSFKPLLQNPDERRLFSLSGEFRDRRLELLYRQGRLESVRGMLHACGIAATLVFSLLVVRDYLVHGPSTTFLHIAAVRCTGLIVGIAFQVAAWRTRTVEVMNAIASIGMVSLTTLTFMTWILSQPPALNAATLAFAYLLIYYLLVPVPSRIIVGNALYVSAGTILITVFWSEVAPSTLVSVLLFIAVGNGLGFVGMRQFKLERRCNYQSREEARRVTEALSLARQESRRRNEYQAWALDALQVGVILFHPGGMIHTINRRAAELLALPPGTVTPGDSHETLIRFLSDRRDFGDLEVSDVKYHIDRLLRGAGSLAAIRHASTGNVLEFTLNRLPDRSVAITISDASERYALHRRLRHAVEVAGDGFAIYDASDRISICSSRFAALYGLTAEQAIGKSFDELMQRSYERNVFTSDAAEAGSTATVGKTRRHVPERIVEIRTTAGEWFLVHERLTPSGDLVVVRTNITARRRMEDELRRAKDDAERALADLRGAQASLILAEKMASLGSLVAGMSHEISTPLGIGVSAASHLSEEVERLTTRFRDGQLTRNDMEDFLDTATEATRIMQGNLTRAARLIQAFKQVSADQTTDEIRAFLIGDYLQEILLSLQPALRHTAHKVVIHCPEAITIRNRPGALSQIVTNLVMNALQHGFEGREEPGLLEIMVSRPRPGRVVIEFRDNGNGISAEHLPRVFDPFFTTRRGTGGTGLGLHIVYNLVSQVLGGTIAVSSRPGEGSRFTISFPQDAAP